MHVVTGLGVGDTRPAGYARLVGADLALAPEPLAVPAREVIATADLGGTLGVLRSAGGALSLVRAGGAETPITGLPAGFVAHALVATADGRALVAGIANGAPGTRVVLAEETATGWTVDAPPIADSAVGDLAAARAGDDLYVAHASGAPVSLSRRRAGTWTTQPIGVGGEPRLAIAPDGAVHVTTSYYQSAIKESGFYTRVDADGPRGWALPPLDGFAHDPNAAIAPPAPSVAADGTVAIGYVSAVHVRHPGEHAERTGTFEIRITGSGRVTSLDATVDCTQTCTVSADVGRIVVLRATTAGGTPVSVPGEFALGYVFRLILPDAVTSPVLIDF